MKATKTQKEVTRTITEKQPVYTLELSHAEAVALYNLVSIPTYRHEESAKPRYLNIRVEGSDLETIDWIVYNAIADLVEPSKEDE